MSESPGFASLCQSLTQEGQDFTCDIPAGWMQGRTAYGGLTTGLAYHALQRFAAELPPLRSFQTSFIGPVTAQSTFTPSILRQGRNVTFANVDVKSGDQICARTSFVFGQGRDSVLAQMDQAPPAVSPEASTPFFSEAGLAVAPAFFSRFETRLSAGARPGEKSDHAFVQAWSRHQDPGSREGTGAFVCLADVLPPAAIVTFDRMVMISSVNWQVNILTDDLVTQDGWWQVQSRQTAAEDGYSSQQMQYRDYDGRLVAEGMQSVAVFA